MRAVPSFPILILVSALTVLSLNMFVPALPDIARDFDVPYARASWAVSGYLAVTAVAALLAGPVSDVFGRRPVLLGALSVLTVSAAICALAGGFAGFILARLAMGVVFASMTMAQAMVRDTSDRAEAAKRLSWLAMGMAIGPMIGPVLGGLMAAWVGWQAIFWFISFGGAALLIASLRLVPETRPEAEPQSGSLLTEAGELMRSPAYWSFASSIMFGVGCFFVFISGAPMVADRIFLMPPEWLGISVGIITVGFFVGTGISSRIATGVGVGRMVLAGRISAVLGLGLSALALAAGVVSPYIYFGAVTLVGLGNGLGTPSANAGLMSVRPRLAGTAAGVSGAMTLAGGAVLSGLAGLAMSGGNPAWRLVLVMLAVALAGLVSGVAAWWYNRGAEVPA